eukprot:3721398-Pleurochrysis_carterae.AAC.1
MPPFRAVAAVPSALAPTLPLKLHGLQQRATPAHNSLRVCAAVITQSIAELSASRRAAVAICSARLSAFVTLQITELSAKLAFGQHLRREAHTLAPT